MRFAISALLIALGLLCMVLAFRPAPPESFHPITAVGENYMELKPAESPPFGETLEPYVIPIPEVGDAFWIGSYVAVVTRKDGSRVWYRHLCEDREWVMRWDRPREIVSLDSLLYERQRLGCEGEV